MSNSLTSAAATSSCVESGLEAQSTTSAPPAFRVRIRFAVSVVTWRHAEMRYPDSGCSRSKRSRIADRTGICRSAHMIRRTPSGASDRSFTSCRSVCAIGPLSPGCGPVSSGVSGGEQPLVLPLLPVDPGAGVVAGREPRVDGATQLGLAAQAAGEDEVGRVHVEAGAELAQAAQPVQLGEAVLPVAGGGAPRD